MTTKKSTKSRVKVPSAVYLHRLEVENMRVFGRSQRLDFCTPDGRLAQWTFVLAPNGGGKTTLLRAIVAAHTNFSSFGAHDYPGFQQIPPGDYFNRGSDEAANIELELITDTKLQSPRDTGQAGAIRFHPVDAGKNSSNLTGKIYGNFERLADETFLLAYGAPRKIGTAETRRSTKRDRTFETLFDEDATLRDPQTWLFETDIASRRRANGSAANLRLVKQILADVLPGVSAVRIEVDRQSGRPRAEFKTQDGWIPFEDMSHGYKTMMGWVIDFASRMVQRYPKSKNPLAEPAVVLVDEIDLHLHPQWQRQLIGELTRNFPRTQFVVTAHSPLVVQAAEGANLAVLRRDQKTGEMLIDNDPGNISGWRVDQILTSDLFGIDSARSPAKQEVIDRRTALIRKTKLTAKEAAELEKLNEAVLKMPVLERREEQELLDLLKETVASRTAPPAKGRGKPK